MIREDGPGICRILPEHRLDLPAESGVIDDEVDLEVAVKALLVKIRGADIVVNRPDMNPPPDRICQLGGKSRIGVVV